MGWGRGLKWALSRGKPVFGVSEQILPKPACSATERLAKKVENSLLASLDMKLSKERITNALIRLCGYDTCTFQKANKKALIILFGCTDGSAP